MGVNVDDVHLLGSGARPDQALCMCLMRKGVPAGMVGWLSCTATVLLLSGPRCSIGSEVTMNLGNWNGIDRGVINSLPLNFSIVFYLSKVEWYGFICLFCLYKEEAL